MNRNLQLLVSLSGALLAFVMLTFGYGIYWWIGNRNRLVNEAIISQKDGISFGKTSDNKGCVKEAFQRHDLCKTYRCHVKNNIFLTSCLDRSPKTIGFCRDVPRKRNLLESKKWRDEQCQIMGKDTPHCRKLHGLIQSRCEKITRRF